MFCDVCSGKETKTCEKLADVETCVSVCERQRQTARIVLILKSQIIMQVVCIFLF